MTYYGQRFCISEKMYTKHIRGSSKTIRGITYLEVICSNYGRKKTYPLPRKRRSIRDFLIDSQYEKYIEGLQIASLPKIERKKK